MILITAIILLAAFLTLEFKVKNPLIRCAVILLACFALAEAWLALQPPPPDVNIPRYQRLFAHMTDRLYSLSETQQHALLKANLRKLKKELPRAVKTTTGLGDLVDAMQFVTAETNEPPK